VTAVTIAPAAMRCGACGFLLSAMKLPALTAAYFDHLAYAHPEQFVTVKT
jgi:hypothetical protein